jgi:hypothetical protein
METVGTIVRLTISMPCVGDEGEQYLQDRDEASLPTPRCKGHAPMGASRVLELGGGPVDRLHAQHKEQRTSHSDNDGRLDRGRRADHSGPERSFSYSKYDIGKPNSELLVHCH